MSSVVSFFEIFEWHEWIVLVIGFLASVALIIFGILLGVRHEHKRSRAYKNKWAAITACPSEDAGLVSLTDTSQTLLDGGPSLSPLKRRAARALKLSREPDKSERNQSDTGFGSEIHITSSVKTVMTNEIMN